MKKRFILLLKMLSFYSFIGLLLQALFLNMLLANNNTAQSVKSVKEVYVNMDFKNASLEKAFKIIEASTNFKFAYEKDDLDANVRINLRVRNQTLESVLLEIAKASSLQFRQVNQGIDVKKVVKSQEKNEIEIIIQTRNISGKVISEEDDEPLPGVNVVERGTSNGTVTDVEGRYSLTVQDGAVLIFSSVGYATQEVEVGARSVVDLAMTSDVRALEEIVVIGYGEQKKRDLTGSVATVKSDVIKDKPITRLNEALVGQLAGVDVAINDATPGGEMSIKVRGSGSITAGNEPLYVIDGFPTTQDIANTINPGNIVSVDVLKDASATAIYGSRGSNGVVIITTKSGTSGRPEISLNSSYGVANVLKRDYYDLLNGEEYTEYARELINNSWVRSGEGREASDPNSVRTAPYQIPDFLQSWNGIDTDWQDAIFTTANINNHDLSINGGTDIVKYFFSGGFASDDGVVIGTSYKKYTAQIKLDVNIIDNVLQGGMNLAPAYSNQRIAKYAGTNIYESVIASALAMPPNVPLFNEDGSYGDRMRPTPSLFLPIPNPVQLGELIENYNKNFSTLFNSYLQWNIIEDLQLKTNFGATFNYFQNDFYHPTTAPRFWSPPPVDASGSSSKNNAFNWLVETTLNYRKSFNGLHSLGALLGFSAQRDYAHFNSLSANNFPNDFVHTLNAGEVTGGSSSVSEWSLLSYLARLNYSYRDRYLLTATFRTDGSSRFGKNNKWGMFPSAAVGWVVSNENFLDNLNALSYLKIRASYGVSGNNNIANYGSIALLSYTNQTFGSGAGTNYTGIYPSSLDNPNLTWEKSIEYNIGADIGFLGDNILLNFDVYNRRSSDLLLNVNLPTTSGFSSALTNIGEVENRGYEITLTTKNVNTSTVKWNTSFNLSHNINEVLRLGPTGDPIYGFSGTRITEIGRSVGASRGLLQIGVLTQADIENDVALFPGQTAGDVKYLDVDGDGQISNFNGTDGIFLGDANPHYTFGLNNTVMFHNFDLSLMINGQTGGKTMDLTSQGLWDPDGSNVMRKQWDGRYVSDDEPGNGITPRAGMIAGGMPDSRLVQKTDYLRVRQLALGYTFPFQNIPISNMRVYASVTNLITWKSFEGFNPQALSWGGATNATIYGLTGGGSYPLPRIVSLGLNVTL